MSNNVFAPKYKRAVLDRIESNLFQATFIDFNERLSTFINQHYTLTPRSFETAFRYRGTVYGEFKRRYQVVELNESLKPAFGDFVKEKQDFYDRVHAPIMNMITQALNQCKNPADLLVILPEHTHQAFYNAIKDHLPNYQATLTEEVKEVFQQKYAYPLQLLKERLALKLLLE